MDDLTFEDHVEHRYMYISELGWDTDSALVVSQSLSLVIVRGHYIPRANLSYLRWKALICFSSVAVIDYSSSCT